MVAKRLKVKLKKTGTDTSPLKFSGLMKLSWLESLQDDHGSSETQQLRAPRIAGLKHCQVLML